MRPLAALQRSTRPVLIFGAGVRGCHVQAQALATILGIPVAVTWAARDMFPDSLGGFGTHGVRGANLAVQNADWLLAIGTRLDTKATGSPASGFAPKALRFMVDVDRAEIDKFAHLGLAIEGICVPAAEFLSDAHAQVRAVAEQDGGFPDFAPWRRQCAELVRDNPPGPGRPYEIMAELSAMLRPDDVVVSDTGCCLAWAMQALRFSGQRFVHAFNQTPMGYGLPAAIGAAFASGRRVVLLTGDGGLMVNIGELATVAHHALPIKIILFENRAHAMCEQSQRQWLDGRYVATSEPDLSFPDFAAVFAAFGIDATIYKLDPEEGVSPQVKYGDPLA